MNVQGSSRNYGVRKFAAILTVMLAVGPAHAGDHLYPVGSDLTDPPLTNAGYERQLAYLFREVFNPDVVARLVVLPSFRSEYAVALTEDNGDYKILVLRLANPLWGFEQHREQEVSSLSVDKNGKISGIEEEIDKSTKAVEFEREHSLPAYLMDFKVDRCEAPIDPGLGKKITGAWNGMLLDVHFDPPDSDDVIIGMDGVMYYFSAPGNYMGSYAGYAWNAPGPKTELLEEISDSMSGYCEKRDQNSLAKLNKQADDLLKKLN